MVASLELFSGAGGLAKGIELAGAEHVGFVEFNHDACETLRLNNKVELVNEVDVRQFDFRSLPVVDFIAGGPPCQPFSMAGKALGYNDTRDMFPQAVRAIKERTPKAFMFENVKGLLRPMFSDYFEFILKQLTYPEYELQGNDWMQDLNALREIDKTAKYGGLKYNVQYKLLNAADYGIPQKRERVIIVGIRSDIQTDWSFPKQTHSRDALYWDKYVTGQYWKRHGIEPTEHDLRAKATIKESLCCKYGLFPPPHKPWLTVRDAIEGLGEPTNSGSHQLRPGARAYPGHTGSEIDEPAKTIKAGAHGVPGGENMINFCNGSVRYLTVAEAKRIQTFPDDYQITGVWSEAMRQLGNAVPVKLAQTLAESLFRAVYKTPSPN